MSGFEVILLRGGAPKPPWPGRGKQNKTEKTGLSTVQ